MAHCQSERAQMTVAKKPSWLSIANSGVLTATQICGPAPLPCPMPVTGSVQLSWPSKQVEFPKADHTWCWSCASVAVILCTTSTGVPSWHKHTAVMNKTI